MNIPSWNELSPEGKIIAVFGIVFTIALIIFTAVQIFSSKQDPEQKGYTFQPNSSLKWNKTSTGSVTSTTERVLIPLLCRHAEENGDCTNLAKFNLVPKDCCKHGFCCEQAGN